MESSAAASSTISLEGPLNHFQELLAKAHKHFNKLRDLPTYGSWDWEKSYHKSFKVGGGQRWC